jgi:riboflavin biosynthesis pyrimidine reductase
VPIRVPFGSRAAVRAITGASPSAQGAGFSSCGQVKSAALGLVRPDARFGIKRLEANGGGVTNGAFLRAGLLDKISLAIFPAVDGAIGSPNVFNFG